MIIKHPLICEECYIKLINMEGKNNDCIYGLFTHYSVYDTYYVEKNITFCGVGILAVSLGPCGSIVWIMAY